MADLASRKRERRIMTASQVLCLSCIWMELNLRWMMLTMRSISLGEMGRVRDCSRNRFITWVVNSLHACKDRENTQRSALKIDKMFSIKDDNTRQCDLFKALGPILQLQSERNWSDEPDITYNEVKVKLIICFSDSITGLNSAFTTITFHFLLPFLVTFIHCSKI